MYQNINKSKMYGQYSQQQQQQKIIISLVFY